MIRASRAEGMPRCCGIVLAYLKVYAGQVVVAQRGNAFVNTELTTLSRLE
ncbi:MAG: hypothetical protein AB1714_14620 [Acidobacteriota bacterium]